MLQASLDVVGPPALKSVNDVLSGVPKMGGENCTTIQQAPRGLE